MPPSPKRLHDVTLKHRDNVLFNVLRTPPKKRPPVRPRQFLHRVAAPKWLTRTVVELWHLFLVCARLGFGCRRRLPLPPPPHLNEVVKPAIRAWLSDTDSLPYFHCDWDGFRAAQCSQWGTQTPAAFAWLWRVGEVDLEPYRRRIRGVEVILYRGAKCRWVVSFTFRPLWPLYPLVMRWGGPRSQFGHSSVRRKIVAPARIQTLNCQGSLPHRHIQIGSGSHSASYPLGTSFSVPGGEAAGAWRWPLTSI
jgi:hypothetical protein